MTRVAVSPEVLSWARERAGFELADLRNKFPKLADWESASIQPTMKQLQAFAKAMRVPYGFLFLPEPPVIRFPLADFRAIKRQRPPSISPELMDTVHLMRRRQAWLREERMETDAEPVGFVGTASLSDNPASIGQEMQRALGLVDGWAKLARTRTVAVSELREAIERLGVMAIINGIVGNDDYRKLNVNEFRGFALSDPHAPLIFINGADAKSTQMFTLAREFAHLWLGDMGEGLSGFQGLQPGDGEIERFCDHAAAELLIPSTEMRAAWRSVANDATSLEKLAERFKVSPVAIGRRAMDLDLMGRDDFFRFHHGYTRRECRKRTERQSGSFRDNQDNRVGRLFASHLTRAAQEGRVSFKEAYDLTGLYGDAFQEYAREVEIALS